MMSTTSFNGVAAINLAAVSERFVSLYFQESACPLAQTRSYYGSSCTSNEAALNGRCPVTLRSVIQGLRC